MTSAIKYRDHKLGSTVREVLTAFYQHPGVADSKPFGFDVHQGFEFFLHVDNRLYKKAPGVMIPLTATEERELRENVGMGAVEFYLRRPTAGLPPYTVSTKTLLHAATGLPIPME